MVLLSDDTWRAMAGRREGEREGGSVVRWKAMARWRAVLAREKCLARGVLWLVGYKGEPDIEAVGSQIQFFFQIIPTHEFYGASWRCSTCYINFRQVKVVYIHPHYIEQKKTFPLKISIIHM